MDDNIVNEFMKDPVNGGAVLKSSFKAFHTFFMWHIYRIDWEWKPFHEQIVEKLEGFVFGRNKKKNLVINIPPRFGKTKIMESFEAWSFLLNPYSNVIHTSYSDTLIKQSSKNVKNIIASPAFQCFSNNLPLRQDSQKAEYWQTEPKRGEMGGAYRASTLSGALTGFGFGVKNSEQWSGCCFPYHEVVWTDKGKREIGDIVSKKERVKVWSKNLTTGEYELKEVYNWFKNPETDIVRITFSNGQHLDCTPDHKIYTKNRGYVEAKDLTKNDSVFCFSDSFYLCKGKVNFFHNLFSFIRRIYNKIKFFICKYSFVFRFIINFINKVLKRFSLFNRKNCSFTDSIVLCNGSNSSLVDSNSSNLFDSKICSTKNKSSRSNSILHIFGFSSITKIFKSIISRIIIKMSNFHSFFLRTNKSSQNKLMNSDVINNSIFTKMNIIISFIKRTFKKMFFSIFKRNNYSHIGNFIKSFEVGNVFVDNVKFLRHNKHSYCLSVRDNHNMLVGKSQGFLVSNCVIDDPLKASLVTSRSEINACKDFYLNSLISRRNNKTAPFIMIMQRLDQDDLTGYVLESETEDWEQLKLQALNEETGESLWEETMPAETLLKIKRSAPAVFYGQYQQEPIVLGGEVIKSDWFTYYNTREYYPYMNLFGVCDTAQKKGEANDFTVLQLWGHTFNNTIQLLDMVRGKYDAYELEQTFLSTWEKWQKLYELSPYGLYIEDKSSGIGIIQNLRQKTAIPVIPLQRAGYKNDDGITVKADKYSRALASCPYIASGRVQLPDDAHHPISSLVLSETSAFRADLKHKHDDICDCIFDASNIAFGNNSISSFFI